MKSTSITQPGIWSIRCYRMLMRLYPADFRAELGDSVEQAFRDLLRDAFGRSGYAGILRLWFRIVPDFVFSIWQLLTSSSADYLKWYFRLRWVLACGLGSVLANIVTGILAASGILAFFISLGLPDRWTLGGVPAFLCIGLFQSLVLTRTYCRPSLWISLSALGGLVGVLCASILTAPFLSFASSLETPPQGLDLLLLGFVRQAPTAVAGFCVGLFQWLAFKNKSVSATRWAFTCMFGAFLASLVSFVGGTFLLWVGGPAATLFFRYLPGFVAGCSFGLITAGPLKRILWPDSPEQSSTPELLPD